MPIRFFATSSVPPHASAAAHAVLPGQEAAALPATVPAAYLEGRGFAAKAGESVVLPADGATLVLVGTGEGPPADPESLRRAGAAFARAASKADAGAFVLPEQVVGEGSWERAARAVAEGVGLAAYGFGKYKADPKRSALESLALVVPEAELGDAQAGLERAALVVEAVWLARDLVNEPAGAMTPSRFAEIATEVAAEQGLQVRIWDEDDIARERLGGLAGVARGSKEPPRLLRLEYQPEVAGDVPTIAFVGKGITFDSGGLSLKTAEGMASMKTDMSGAAAVLAAMSVLPRIGAPVRVVGLLPVTENMPGGAATKPGDVLRIRNGKTIEVLNTDAEGRLVLADALSIAAEEGVDAIVDLATLTGACVVALGRQIAGLMGNDTGVLAQVRAAADSAGEKVWELPLPEDYKSQIESDVADMKNIGAPGGQAGALVAGLILREFVGEVPWAHLDIAGPARSEVDEGYQRKGGTGFGTRTLIELATSFRSGAPS